MAAFTESLIDFIENTSYDSPPAVMYELAKRGFIDAIGVLFAGRNEPVVRKLTQFASRRGASAQASFLFSQARGLASDAALIGATAAHALDFDDYAFHNHPSAVLVPAILAEAEHLHSSGRDMLLAYIVGYETWAAVMKREKDHLHSKGWHPTALFGGIGVVAALSILHKSSRSEIRNALGLAVAAAGGVLGNFGAMSKPYQGGRAAESGVTALHMAQAGIDAGHSAIDGPQGLLAALSPFGNVDLESPATSLGSEWYGAAHGLNIKRYPTVGASQRVIDAALALQLGLTGEHDLERISEITVHISERHAAVMPFQQPSTAAEAKFSIEFAVAAALYSGSVGLGELNDAYVQRQQVQLLMAKVRRAVGPDDDPVYPVGAKEDWLEVTFENGNQIESPRVERALGHALNPLSNEQLRQKFCSCLMAGSLATTEEAEDLFSTLMNMEQRNFSDIAGPLFDTANKTHAQEVTA